MAFDLLPQVVGDMAMFAVDYVVGIVLSRACWRFVPTGPTRQSGPGRLRASASPTVPPQVLNSCLASHLPS